MQKIPRSSTSSSPRLLVPGAAAAMAFVACLGVTAYLVNEVRERRRLELHAQVRETILREGAVLRSAIMTRAYLLRPLDALVSTNPELNQEFFARFAGQALDRFSQVGVVSLQLARSSKISHLYPVELLKRRAGVNLKEEVAQSAAVETATRSKGFTLGYPHTNDAGELTVFVHTPIFLRAVGDGEPVLWGVGSVEIDVNAMLDEVIRIIRSSGTESPGFALRLVPEGHAGEPKSAFYGRDEFFSGDHETVSIGLPGQTWELASLKIRDVPDSFSVVFLQANGLLLGVLLSFVVWTSIRRTTILNGVVERATRDLSTSRRRLGMLMESSPVGIFEVDPVKGCTYVNARWSELTGLTAEYAQGRGWLRAVHPDDLEWASEAWVRFVSGGENYFEEFRYQRPDGGVSWVECSASRIIDSNGEVSGFTGVALDITARLETERQRMDLEARVLHSQKLESLGVLAGGIAHDFNNLLMGIVGYSELALEDIHVSSDAREHVGEVLLAAKRAATLCSQMLNYAGRGRFTMEVIDLNSIVREVPDLLGVSITKGATLEYRLDDAMHPVIADSAQLVQILLNLVINASEAIGEFRDDGEGLIVIRTGVRQLSTSDLKGLHFHGGLATGASNYFEVEDNGGGMADDVLERLFEPFYTTKFTGRGLGMSAVLGIVGSHEGGISVLSKLGVGTRFTIYLSHVSETEVSSTEEGEASPVSYEGRVLLIDDEEHVRRPAKLLLECVGFTVSVASSGEEGMQTLNATETPFSLVLLDLTMPGMGGEECLRLIRELDSSLPVLLISGYTAGSEVNEALSGHRVSFLSKPFGRDGLLVAVRELLA